MKRILIVTLASAALVLPVNASFAQRGQGSSKPKVSGAAAGMKAHGGTVKTQVSSPKGPSKSGKTTMASGPKQTTKPMKPAAAGGSKKTTTTVAGTKSAKATTNKGGAAAPGKTKKSSTTTGTTTTANGSTVAGSTSTTTSTTSDDVVLTPVQQKLQKNTNLASKLQSRLPEGTDLMLAAKDFRNLGQFVAAVNVSNNLGIPFDDLKMKMVDEGLSLGQSIQALKPTASSTVEAQRADYEARGMILEADQQTTSGSVTVTSTTSPTKGKTKKRGDGGLDE